MARRERVCIRPCPIASGANVGDVGGVGVKRAARLAWEILLYLVMLAVASLILFFFGAGVVRILTRGLS